MKLIITIVQDLDAEMLIEDLNDEGYRVTRLASTGGFLKSGNTTLLIGTKEEKVEGALDLIRKNGKIRNVTSTMLATDFQGEGYIPYPIEVSVGGATTFVLDVEEYLVY